MTSLSERYTLFVFDLDGTLADTREDITASVNHALRRFRVVPLSADRVTMYVGDGARALMERVLGPTAVREDLDRALVDFLAHYREACTRNTRLYPGVTEALAGLRGKDLAVLTNKPELHTLKILSTLKILGAFRKVVSGDGPWPKKPDPAGLLSLVEGLGHPKDRALLVGDSGVDVQTARAAGVSVAFVTYGFRPEAAREHAPDHVLSSLTDLLTEIP